jgi:hypothetical protein
VVFDHEAPVSQPPSHKAVAGKGRKQGSGGRRQEKGGLLDYEDPSEGDVRGEQGEDTEEEGGHRRSSSVGKAGRDRKRPSVKAAKVAPSNEEEGDEELKYPQNTDRTGQGARREERGKRREKRGSESGGKSSGARRSKGSINAGQSRERPSQSRQMHSGGGGGGQDDDAEYEPELEYMT